MSEETLYTFENPEYRKTYWHTCSHIMAQAVKRLWPEVMLAIGPAIDEGWYYDFDASSMTGTPLVSRYSRVRPRSRMLLAPAQTTITGV